MPSKLVMMTWDDGSSGVPTPPIHYPPSVWPNPPGGGGGGSVWPGQPTPPIFYPPSVWPNPPGHGGGGGSVWPGQPTPPIFYPPSVWPNPPGQPPSIWNPAFPTNPIAPGGGGPVVLPPLFPTNPIVIPMPPSGGDGPDIGTGDKYLVYWNPKYGWMITPIEGPDSGAPTPAPKPVK